MAEAEQKADSNFNPNPNPREVLQKLILKETTYEEEGEIELSLGLSLNGRFGVDPKRATNLSRSSSVSDFASTNEQSNSNRVSSVWPPLIRTCSLPTESEEEWRKRKEVQSIRRMEAKRKRVEKLRNLRSQGSVELNSGEILKSQRNGVEKGNPPIPSSQGSIGSRGSGSSGISESGSQPHQGLNGCTEARSPASVQSLPKRNEHILVVTPGTSTEKPVTCVMGAATENPSAKVAVNDDEAKDSMRNMMVDMPCVSTREVGPNGKRVEGFLYRYRKGEEVRIVCVCHGSFLTPAEFVKHGGGGDVAQPLKHIVVSPSPIL